MARISWRSNAADVRLERRRAAIEELVAESIEKLAAEVSELEGCYLTRSELSRDLGVFKAYVHSMLDGVEASSYVESLKLYAPAIRKYVAEALNLRKTPKILFFVDEKQEELERLEDLLLKVSEELKSESSDSDGEAGEGVDEAVDGGDS